MEKEYLERMIVEGYTSTTISKKENKSISSVRYWINKHGLWSNLKEQKEINTPTKEGKRKCPKCNEMLGINEFNSKRGIEGASSYCKRCTTTQTTERMKNLKIQMAGYKGGCCQKCGYDKYIGALEFHHIDPAKKDFNPSNLKRYKFDEKVKNELDKCVLLCSNCHRETHHEINEKKKELC